MFIKSSEFNRQFKKLPIKIQDKAEERLRILLENEFHPILNNHKLSGPSMDYRSTNVTGDFRIIYKVLGGPVYFLVEIGTHSQLYG